MARFVLAPAAEQDIVSILAWTHEHFGEQARLRYEALLIQAIEDIADNPERPGSTPRDGLVAGGRSYHLRHSRDRVVKAVGQVGEIYKDQNICGVIVRGETSLHSDLRTLSDLRIDTPAGGQVPLGSVADLSIVPAPNEIKREAASRRIDITCNVDGRDLASVATNIERAVLANLSFKTGHHPEFLGEYAEAKASRNRLLLLSLASICGIAVILYIDFQSWKLVGIILCTLPLALLGGVLGVHASGGILSLGSLVAEAREQLKLV